MIRSSVLSAAIACLLTTFSMASQEEQKEKIARRTFVKYSTTDEWSYNGKFAPFHTGNDKKNYAERNFLSFSLPVDDSVNLAQLKALTNADWKKGDKVYFTIFLLKKHLKDLKGNETFPLLGSPDKRVFTKTEISLKDIDDLKLASLNKRISALQDQGDELGLNYAPCPVRMEIFSDDLSLLKRHEVLMQLMDVYKAIRDKVAEGNSQKQSLLKDCSEQKALRAKKSELTAKAKELAVSDLSAGSDDDSLNSSDDSEDRKTILEGLRAKISKVEKAINNHVYKGQRLAQDNKAQSQLIDNLKILNEKLAALGQEVSELPIFEEFTKAISEEDRAAKNKALEKQLAELKKQMTAYEEANRQLLSHRKRLDTQNKTLKDLNDKIEAVTNASSARILETFPANSDNETRLAILKKNDQGLEEANTALKNAKEHVRQLNLKNKDRDNLLKVIAATETELGVDSGAYVAPEAFDFSQTVEQMNAILGGMKAKAEELQAQLKPVEAEK